MRDHDDFRFHFALPGKETRLVHSYLPANTRFESDMRTTHEESLFGARTARSECEMEMGVSRPLHPHNGKMYERASSTWGGFPIERRRD